ncbi:MAG: magnesium chelatase subunit D [Pseudomonadota bacterium]
MRVGSEDGAPDRWTLSVRALDLARVDPRGLGGVRLHAHSGPVRDLWLSHLRTGHDRDRERRIAPSISDQALFGGLDLAATLEAGRTVRHPGLLNDGARVLILTMAERADAGLAAKLAGHLDEGSGHLVIALDESEASEAGIPPALDERLAFPVDLDGLRPADCLETVASRGRIAQARLNLRAVTLPADVLESCVILAARLGISGLRAPIQTARTARAAAALDGRQEVSEADIALAAQLVLAPRLRCLPEGDDAEQEPPPPENGDRADETETESTEPSGPSGDRLLEAVTAVLPPNLLEQLRTRTITRDPAASSGQGAVQRQAQRGRPLPALRGHTRSRSRIDLVETLKAAAPWQTMRHAARPDDSRPILFQPDDIRLRRFCDRRERLVVFAVDASGSTALARLAEAKGAIELLLGEAYSRRDQVALISFRGTDATLLLPPTRSLVRTKRCLSALPGGGGTPLAAGLQAAFVVSQSERRRGVTASMVVLTDGRANIALDGTADRSAARDDSHRLARLIGAGGVPSMVIDTSLRPRPEAERLADALGGHYLPLPHAGASRLSEAVNGTLLAER